MAAGCHIQPDNSHLSPPLRFVQETKRSTGEKVLEVGTGLGRAEGRRPPAGSEAEVNAHMGTVPGKLAPCGPCVPKARGRGSLSLCLFPFNNTSVCNLRQVGEEKKKEEGKKKRKREK